MRTKKNTGEHDDIIRRPLLTGEYDEVDKNQVNMIISIRRHLQAGEHNEVAKHAGDHADIEQADPPIWSEKA